MDDFLMEWEVYLLSRPIQSSTLGSPGIFSNHWILMFESKRMQICFEANKSEKDKMLSPKITVNEVPEYKTKRSLGKIFKTYCQLKALFKSHKLNYTAYNCLTNNCQKYVNELCDVLGISNPTLTAKDVAVGVGVGVGIGALALGLLGFLGSSNEKQKK